MNLHQFGLSEEVTYGTYVAPTRFYEILPGESLARRQTVIQSEGLRRGQRFPLGERRVLTRHDAGGQVSFEIATTGFGVFFEHMLGGAVSILDSTSLAYKHTFTEGDLDGSLTLQKGVEKTDGTVQAFSYYGSKITDWEISIAEGGIANLSLTFDCEQESTSDSLATASYGSTSLFHFGQASLEVDDSVIAVVSDATVTGQNDLKTDRYFIGQTGVKLEQREQGFRSLSGNLTAEFENITDFYNLFKADTSAKLELIFTGALIEDTSYETLHITVNDVRFTGETPAIEGVDVAVQNIPWIGVDDGTTEPIQIEYISTDTTP